MNTAIIMIIADGDDRNDDVGRRIYEFMHV